MQEKSSGYRDVVEMAVFNHFLRTGRRVNVDGLLRMVEQKFNHRHLVENGQFAAVGEGIYFEGGDSGESGRGLRNSSALAGTAKRASSVRAQQGSPAKESTKSPAPLTIPNRKEIIASGKGNIRIQIRNNPYANSSAPPYELPRLEQVSQNEPFIISAARRNSVDPDLIIAIVYVETTHGYYDSILNPFDANKSILPMNINTAYWGDTWGSIDSLKIPAANIEAGARMLRSIQLAMPGASIEKIATIYNDSNAVMVNSYGARVQAVYKAKSWIRHRPNEIPILKY